MDAKRNKIDLEEEIQKVLEEIDANQNEIGALNEQASKEMVSSNSERSFRPDMVSSGPDEVKEPRNPKVVGSVADKVADDVDTVIEVVKKVEEPVVESKAVESMPEKVVDKVKTVDEVVEKVEKSVIESKPVEQCPTKSQIRLILLKRLSTKNLKKKDLGTG